jgi:hypothetical protein
MSGEEMEQGQKDMDMEEQEEVERGLSEGEVEREGERESERERERKQRGLREAAIRGVVADTRGWLKLLKPGELDERDEVSE